MQIEKNENVWNDSWLTSWTQNGILKKGEVLAVSRWSVGHWSDYLRYQESGQDRNMLGAVWESEVFQIQIQRYKHNINMYEKQIFVKRNKN